MNKYYKKINSNPDYKRLFENFFSLSVLQGANYLLPLITLPYLVRVLGPEKFGLIAFAQAFVQYFAILTDYGFNLSATRELSIHREDKQKVSEIFSAVMTIKIALMVVSFILLSIIVFSFNKFRADWTIYFLTFGMVVGQVLFPVWFFQGMERMKYITFLNLLAKSIFTIAIFIFIHSESHFIFVPLINSLGFIVAGLIALWIVFKDFGVKFILPSSWGIKHQLKEGWHIFISTVAISLYTVSNTFILGLFTNNTIVGYYSAAEKIIKAIQGMLTPFSQTIYPYISNIVSKSKEKGIQFIKKITVLVGSVSFLLSLIIFIFANFIVKILLGPQYIESIVVLRILSFLPFIIALSNILAVQGLIAFGFSGVIPEIVLPGCIINLFLSFILVPYFHEIGSAISWLVTEIIITLLSYKYFRRECL